MSESKHKQLEEWDVGRLLPYENNAKVHTKAQIKKIANSIREHGLINPPNVEADGTIISGHGRLLAIRDELGWETLPVFVRYDLNKAQAAAARLADNKVAEGDINTNLVQEELRWLEKELDHDLTLLGFDERELAFLTEDIGVLDEELLSAEVDLPDYDDAMGSSTGDEIDTVDDSRVRLDKAFGIKEVTGGQSRQIKRFMAMIASDYHEGSPADALAAHIEEVLNG